MLFIELHIFLGIWGNSLDAFLLSIYITYLKFKINIDSNRFQNV